MSNTLQLGPNGGFGILAKLNAVSAGISGYVQKDKKNKDQGYTFVSEAGYIAVIRPLLVENNVVMMPVGVKDCNMVLKQKPAADNKELLTTSMLVEHITVQIGFFDTQDGSCVIAEVRASGSDQNDKAAYKAMTGAMKYAMAKTFNLASGDDAEDDRFSEPDAYEPPASKTFSKPGTDKGAEVVAPKKVVKTEEEEAPAPKAPKKAAAPKPAAKEEEEEEAPAPAPKASKKAGPFNGEIVADVDLDAVYAQIVAAETHDAVSEVVNNALKKVEPMKRGLVNRRLKPHIEEKVLSLSGAA